MSQIFLFEKNSLVLGMIAAGITMGTLSDKIGRKKVLVLNMFGSFVTMIVSAFIADFW